jgi:hypothetical protein
VHVRKCNVEEERRGGVKGLGEVVGHGPPSRSKLCDIYRPATHTAHLKLASKRGSKTWLESSRAITGTNFTQSFEEMLLNHDFDWIKSIRKEVRCWSRCTTQVQMSEGARSYQSPNREQQQTEGSYR